MMKSRRQILFGGVLGAGALACAGLKARASAVKSFLERRREWPKRVLLKQEDGSSAEFEVTEVTDRGVWYTRVEEGHWTFPGHPEMSPRFSVFHAFKIHGELGVYPGPSGRGSFFAPVKDWA